MQNCTRMFRGVQLVTDKMKQQLKMLSTAGEIKKIIRSHIGSNVTLKWMDYWLHSTSTHQSPKYKI